MKKIFIISFFLMLAANSFSQSDKNKLARVFEADSIIWYGLDFSEFKLTNPSKLSHGPIIKYKYMNEWLKLYNSSGNQLKKRIKRSFKMNTLLTVRSSSKSIIDSIDENDIVINTPHKISKDVVNERIQTYNSTWYKGIGFVVIVENFNKLTEQVSVLFLIFDIDNKQIISLKRVTSKARGAGMIRHWGRGLVDCTEKYFFEYIAHEFKKYKTNKRKSRSK